MRAQPGLRIRVREALDDTASRLRAAGIEDARREARLLLRAAAGLDIEAQIAAPDRSLAPGEQDRLESLVERRTGREPMAYILGEREFWSLTFKVGPGVLIPRPETEVLLEAALEGVSDRGAHLRILDLGTGSGCLLLAALSELPNATGVGIDTSEGALAYARANAERLGLADRAGFRACNWHELAGERFDLVLCNPPYVARAEIARLAPEIRDFEPHAALDGGPDGLDAYRGLASLLPRVMAARAIACIELGAGQAHAVGAMFEAAGFPEPSMRTDLRDIARCLVLRAPG